MNMPTLAEMELRRWCIEQTTRIASPHVSVASIIGGAEKLESYVTGRDVAAAERRLAAVDAALKGDAGA